MSFAPSPQQAAFFDWIDTGSGSAVLEAVAGAGKTTTLIQGLARMEGTIFFGAYNKAIADEIRARVGARPRLVIGTMHSAGFNAWRRAAPDVKVDGNKCRTIFREASDRTPSYRRYESATLALVSYAKQAGLGAISPVTPEALVDLVDHYGVELPSGDDVSQELLLQLASRTLKASIERDTRVVDFDDMIYSPLRAQVKVFTNDWVLVDEAQDTNATRRELAFRMLKPGGRLVAVGDPHQAIYGFTGADSDALDLIAERAQARRLPLTVTYRCPKTVVAHAQQWVNHIEAAPTAPEGAVTEAPLAQLKKLARPGDAVLCRFVAPLVRNIYGLIAAGVPAKMEGREIGDGLRKLATRWKTDSLAQLSNYIDAYQEAETRKLEAKEATRQIEALADKCDCLRVIIDRVKTVDRNAKVEELVAEIDRMFGTDEAPANCVTFSTVHRAKGREWERVLWIQTGASPYARQPWEQAQEVNLMYVAATRAKAELFLLQ